MEDFYTWYIENRESFDIKLKEERRKLPYNLNILDEIHANENAHSRILVKFLQYKKNGNFILKSFLQSLGNPFNEIPVEHPMITAEKDRIDIRIRDKEYSIIIENKIHGANDQDSQIERYIEIEENHRDKEKVYVLYLTRSGGAPSEYSFSSSETWNKAIRYKEISFKDHILPWIKKLEYSDDFSNILHNDFLLLQSALIQYKNHLQGMFYEREGEKKMEAEMKQYLKSKLGLSDDSSENIKNIKSIDKHLNSLTEMQGFLEGIKNETLQVIFDMLKEVVESINKELREGAYTDFQSPVEEEGRFGEQYSAIYITPKDWNDSYSIGFSYDSNLDEIFYGIFCNDDPIPDELSGILAKVFHETDKSYIWWVYWNYFDEYKCIENISQLVSDIHSGKFKEAILEKLLEIYNEIDNEINKNTPEGKELRKLIKS